MRSKKAIFNIITNLILQLIVIVYGFIVPKIIISKFGSNVNGLVTSITQFLTYITLLESGFGPVVKSILYKPIANKDKGTIEKILKAAEKFFRTIAIIFVVYIIILAFIYPVIVNNEFSFLYTVSLILIISVSTFSEYFFGMTYRLYLQAEQKTYVISFIQIITYILSVICIIILAKLNCSIHFIKLVSCLIFVLKPIIQNIYIQSKYKINLKNVEDDYKLKNKWDGLAQHIAAVIHGNTDITILTLFTSLVEVSVYSVYLLVLKGVKALIQAFTNGLDSSFGDMIAKEEYENLNNKFNTYEVAYFIIIAVVFTCTMLLIVPFIENYTRGISDANYIRYVFGYLLVISEYIWAIRLPYSSLTLAAGHFKETRIGAWIEAIVNIIVSVVLVIKFGIIGVAVGTIIAMLIRTIEFMVHTNKYILKRSLLFSLKKILLIISITLISVNVVCFLPLLNNLSYIHWIVNAIIIATLVSLITLVINYIFFRDELKSILMILKKFFKKEKA